MEKQYYIFSAKWTKRHDVFLTLWRSGSAGYCWRQDWAGVYSEEEAKRIHGRDNSFMIEKSLADSLFVLRESDGEQVMVLENRMKVRKALGIKCNPRNRQRYYPHYSFSA